MIVERPAQARVETLRRRLGYIMKKGTPAQPQVIRGLAQAVEHHQGMGEVILMPDPFLRLHSFQGTEFGENQRQQSATFQQVEADRRFRRKDDLIQLIHDTLFRDDRDALLVPFDRIESVGIDKESQLAGKADGTHHAQRIVAKRNIRIERRTDQQIIHIGQAIERIDQFTIPVLIQAKRQSIDRKVTAVLVVFERPVFDNRLAAVMRVGFLAGADKLQFQIAGFHLCRTEVLEDGQISSPSQFPGNSFCQLDSAPDGNDIDIFGRTMQKDIPHITAYHICFNSQLVRRLRNQMKRFRRNMF